jgi:hypothetical protein
MFHFSQRAVKVVAIKVVELTLEFRLPDGEKCCATKPRSTTPGSLRESVETARSPHNLAYGIPSIVSYVVRWLKMTLENTICARSVVRMGESEFVCLVLKSPHSDHFFALSTAHAGYLFGLTDQNYRGEIEWIER